MYIFVCDLRCSMLSIKVPCDHKVFLSSVKVFHFTVR